MCAEMTRERAEEFGAAWNSRDADLVTSFFAENGVYHASVGLNHYGVCVQPVSATPLAVYRLAFGSPRSFADVD